MPLQHRILVFSVLFFSFFLAGCTISNPHIDIPRPIRNSSESTALSEGIDYARNAQTAYRAKLAARARLEANGGAALIALASAALGFTAFDSNTDVIKGTALAGGTGFYLGNWYSNESHELIYIRGLEAINCAVEAVLPLNLSNHRQESLEEDIDELNEAIVELIEAIAQTNALAKEMEDNKTKDSLKQMATLAANFQVKAVEVYSEGYSLLHRIDGANAHLVAAVDRINVAVDSALRQTNPRLESLTSVVQQLSGAVAIFTPRIDSPEGLIGTASVVEQSLSDAQRNGDPCLLEEQETEAQRMLRLLSQALWRTVASSLKVNTVLKSVGDAQPLATLEDCDIDVDALPTNLSLSPTAVSIREGTAAGRTIVIRGGKKPYMARFLVSPTPGLTLQSPMPGDSAIEVAASEDTNAGEYSVLVSDAANNHVTFNIVVTGT